MSAVTLEDDYSEDSNPELVRPERIQCRYGISMSRYDNWCGIPVWSPVVVDVEGMRHDRVQPVAPHLRRAGLVRKSEYDIYIPYLVDQQKWRRFERVLQERFGDPEAESELESMLDGLIEL